jgi:signal transduction histidine kinase
VLLHGVSDLNSIQGIAVQALRPLGTVGAAAMLFYISILSDGRRRIAWTLIATAIFFSVLYSTFKITLNIAVTTPFMRVIWLIIYVSALVGGAAYIPPSSWSSLKNVLSTLRIVISCITIGCSFFVIIYGAFVLYDSSLLLNDIRIVNLPNFAFDIAFVFLVGLVCHERPAMKLIFLCVFCVFIDNVIHIYMSITTGFYTYQGRNYLIFPINTLQSVILAFAAYRDAIYKPNKDTTKNNFVIGLNEWLIWTFFPLILSLVAFFAVGMSRVPSLYPLSVLLGVSMIMHALLTAYDYHRALRNQQLATVREQHVRELMRYFQHELLGYVKALNGLMPMLQTSLPSSTSDRSLAESEQTLHVMDATIGQLDDLVKELLLISRDGLLLIPAPAPIALKLLVDQTRTVTAYRPEVQVNIDAPDEDVFVYGNALYLSLAIKTALRNALEALDQLPTARPGQLSLTLVTTEQRVFLHLEDSGPGFSSEVLERLERLHVTKQPLTPGWSTKTNGYGLGLALIDRIVALHEGIWECGNLPNGCGAWIEIILPRWSPAAKPAHAAEWAAPRVYP